jgi:YHS domain-containing protein
VLEVGIVLWLLLGWQFALAELVGGVLMIALISTILPRVMRADELEEARRRLETRSTGGAHGGHESHAAQAGDDDTAGRARTLAGWSDAASYTISDLTMLRRELFIGFLVAGFLDVAVPVSFWQSLFITGHGFWSSLENAVLGPFLAIISFVCSVGNVPLAAALWTGGISFGGGAGYAKDPVCGMQIERSQAPATAEHGGQTYWFCSDHCQHRFVADPEKFVSVADGNHDVGHHSRGHEDMGQRDHGSADGSQTVTDPVCGMQVAPDSAAATVEHDGRYYYFCSTGCRDTFVADPEQHLAAADR